MTHESSEETYRAVGVDGTLSAHARHVEFFVRWRDGISLLANVRGGRERLLSSDEFEERIAQGFATRLASPLEVGHHDSGLVLNAGISEALSGSAANPLNDFERRTHTEDGDVVIIGHIDLLDSLMERLAAALADKAREDIIRASMQEVRCEPVAWEEVEACIQYALHCAASGPRLQYLPVLLRCWLLRRDVQSTQIGNFHRKFLADTLTWQDFQAQLDALDHTVRAEVDHRLWMDHARRLEETRRERIQDQAPSPGTHPRQASPPGMSRKPLNVSRSA